MGRLGRRIATGLVFVAMLGLAVWATWADFGRDRSPVRLYVWVMWGSLALNAAGLGCIALASALQRPPGQAEADYDDPPPPPTD